MAITSRAKRNTSLVRNQLPEFLGPGSYDVATNKKRLYGQAPFGSTSHRNPQGSDVFVTPGPGAYGEAPDFEARGNRSAAFASTSHRMLSELELPRKAMTPGPGAYDPAVNAWRKPTSAPGPLEPTVTKAVNWVKVSTAPSIPAPAQSYGYEEGPHGALVQQKPAIQGFAGTPIDAPGPGHYEPDSDLLKRSRATTFGRGKTRDCLNLSKELVSHPGPGTYDLRVVPADEIRPSSVFMSATSRAKAPKNDEKRSTPGPGTYPCPKMWKTAEDLGAPGTEHVQAFGSTSRQLFRPISQQHPVPIGNVETPGPGTYEIASKVKKPKDLAVAGDAAPRGAFDSTAPRFSPSRPTFSATPGPGYYYNAEAGGMVREIESRVVGRYGVFGTTSQRFPSKKAEDALGPGAYDTKLATELAKPRKKDPRSAVFASRTKREPPAVSGNDDAKPPVGAYTVPSPEWVKKSVNCSNSVRPHAPRFKERPRAESPGPGSYSGDLTLGEAKN